MNQMIKLSDEEFTPHRRYELALSIQNAFPNLMMKFKTEIDSNPKDIDIILFYSNEALDVLKKNYEDNIPK